MKYLSLGVLLGLIVGCNESRPPAVGSKPLPDRAATTAVKQSEATVEAVDRTNTGINIRDRDNTTKTALDQNENTADIKITSDIRKRVVDTKLSTTAQNVKIITQDGKVTLRGPVKAAGEKQKIEEIAVTIAGVNNVDNQLEISK